MISLERFFNLMKKSGIHFVTGVPDSLLNNFCLYAQDNLSKSEHVITANEGNAIALAAGNYLATGHIPMVYMQNSGLGNAMNPLISLTNKEVYGVPMILLIGWRGEPNVSDWAHHKRQGELTPVLLDGMNIPYKIIGDDEESFSTLTWAVDKTKEINSPVALVAKKGALAEKEKENIVDKSTELMNREEAIQTIIKALPENTVYVASTGRATREIYEVRNQMEQSHDLDILNVGAMGHASSLASGIALGQPERLVVCLDGDASALMHMGSFTTSGMMKQKNFLHIVLNNGVHESVGGQNSVAQKVDLTGIAQSSGYLTAGKSVSSKEDLLRAVKTLVPKDGSGFIDLHIRKGIRPDIPALEVSLTDLKNRFRIAMNN